ncbi:MAG TPA: ribonuclease H family protein [Bryobacteraceae bacterium]|nr:ribonuclease H family protein [Bryobacteraceae bacterium]
MNKSKPKFYVVWQGRTPGIYGDWTTASEQVTGVANARFKSFLSRADAEAAFRGKYWSYAGKDPAVKKTSVARSTANVIKESISVDAACSGNPGRMEYRGVHTHTRDELFLKGPYEDGTNNVGEFLAIVQALQLSDLPIYSDSRTAQSWVRLKKCRTTLERTSRNGDIFDLIDHAEAWLRANPFSNPILKWETSDWGEIPADFGRK